MFSSKGRSTVLASLHIAIGVLICAVSAAILVFVTRDTSFRPSIPLLFILVIVLVAIWYGMAAASIGAFVASMLFAYFLFTPVGSFQVQKGEARTNLIWMFLVGVPIGYFACATKSDIQSKHRDHA